MDIVTDGPVLVLSGDFDARSTWEVRNALRERLVGPGDGQGQDVVVDLTNVSFIDATATRVLAYASREAALSGNHVTLRGCGPAVRRMLHLSRLMRFVDVERAAATA
jgi:anti-anti-sigma factor